MIALIVVLVAIFGLLVFMWISIAREPGPGAADVALAYEHAWDELDFSLLYDLSGDEMRDGMRRERFVAAKRAAYEKSGPHARIGADVKVETSISGHQTALVVTCVAAGGGSVRNNVMLERRSNGWVVVGYSLRPDTEADAPTLVTAAGVLLTGGASRRMGIDKATLLVAGESLGTRTARLLAAVCDPVVEVGRGVTSLRAVREDPPGGGPLAALLAGADALATSAPIVLLACDLPCMDEAVLRMVADHPGCGSVVPVVDAHRQYACSRWSVAAIVAARAAFVRGETAMRVMLEADDVTLLSADEHARALSDVDAPEDLARLGLT